MSSRALSARVRSDLVLFDDIGLKKVTQAQAQIFLDTRALNAAFDASTNSVGVYALFNQNAGAFKLKALGLASVSFSADNVATCTIHGVKVHDEARNDGIGNSLFRRLHSLVFELVQHMNILALKTKCLRLNAERPLVHVPGVRIPPSSIRYVLAAGDCFRNPAALLLYHSNGAIITANAGEVRHDRNSLLNALQGGRVIRSASVDFPTVSFWQPYLSPVAHSSVSPSPPPLGAHKPQTQET